MIKIFLLVLVAFFFPPVWAVLVVYIIYLVLTKESREGALLMREINGLIVNKREDVILKKVGYGTAKKIAAAKGALMSIYKNDPEDDTLWFEISHDGNRYDVCVQRWLINSTLLTVKPKGETRNEIISKLGEDHFLSQLLKNQQ